MPQCVLSDSGSVCKSSNRKSCTCSRKTGYGCRRRTAWRGQCGLRPGRGWPRLAPGFGEVAPGPHRHGQLALFNSVKRLESSHSCRMASTSISGGVERKNRQRISVPQAYSLGSSAFSLAAAKGSRRLLAGSYRLTPFVCDSESSALARPRRSFHPTDIVRTFSNAVVAVEAIGTSRRNRP